MLRGSTSKKVDKRYMFFVFQIVSPFIAAWAAYQYATIPLLLVSALMFFLMKCVGQVITYHRVLGHKTHVMHPWVEFVCTALGFYGSLITPVAWCAMHINHHKYADTWKDPHPPTLLGWKAAFAVFWNDSGPNSGDLKTAARLQRNKICMFFEKYYWPLLVLPFALLAVSTTAFWFVYFIPLTLSFWSLHITVFGHDQTGPKYMGLLYGIVSMGEHHHKWHHDHPNDTTGEGWLDTIINLITIRPVKKS